MNWSWRTRVFLALASGLTLALSFPNYNLSLLAWVSVSLLVLASVGARPAVASVYGMLCGLVFYPMSLTWIDVVMRQYGDVGFWTSAGILALIGIAGGLIFAIFTWGVALASRGSRLFACTLAPFLWVAIEFARANLPIIAFPWNLLGYAASGNLALVQLTAITGIYGLSFVIAAFGSLLAYAILSGRHRAGQAVLVAAAVLIIVARGGVYLVPQAQAHHVAHLVQTNFPQSEEYPADWDRIHAGEMNELQSISVEAGKREPGLIVWPEVPAPFSFQEGNFAGRATAIARDSGTDFLVGVVDWKRDSAGKLIASNSAVLLDPAGQRIFTYDKIHLVPFGEYVPLRQWLTFAGRLTADISDFTPGAAYTIGDLRYGSASEQKFGAFICYEAVFPNEARHFTLGGAELLINMSNDGWFGRSSAPAQHLMMARVRAVENRRWLLRDTNNGYTVSVDPYGRIVAELGTDFRGELDAPYDFRSDLTPYTRFGDWFAWLCVLASVALLAIVIFSWKPNDLLAPDAGKGES